MGQPNIFIVFMILVVLSAIIVSVASIILSASPFVALAWFFSKRSKEAKAVCCKQVKAGLRRRVGLSNQAFKFKAGKSTGVLPRVIYKYTVNNRFYKSEQIKAGDKFLRIQMGSPRSAYDTYDTVYRYPVGANVAVFYDPNNPSESALER